MDDPGKLLRLFREINLLAASQRGYTVFALADKLGVSYRTIYRDMKIFEQTGFELVQLKNKKYKLNKSEEISKNITFDKNEAEALRQAMVTLNDSSIKHLLMNKINALSESAVKVNTITKTAVAGNFNKITQAIALKSQVYLIDYASGHSGNISNRLVEPFAFSLDGDSVQCLEVSSKINKFFKLERIGEVKLLHRKWEHEHYDEKSKEDIFGMSMTKPVEVVINMGILATNLIKEEYPASNAQITSLADGRYELRTHVEDYKAIGRFVLGLMEDVHIESPPEFKRFVKKKLANQKLI